MKVHRVKQKKHNKDAHVHEKEDNKVCSVIEKEHYKPCIVKQKQDQNFARVKKLKKLSNRINRRAHANVHSHPQTQVQT